MHSFIIARVTLDPASGRRQGRPSDPHPHQPSDPHPHQACALWEALRAVEVRRKARCRDLPFSLTHSRLLFPLNHFIIVIDDFFNLCIVFLFIRIPILYRQ
jgi:hypothetical protein